MAAYLEDAPSMTFEEYEFLYNAAKGHDREDKEDQELRELPTKLAYGVTMILAGGFLCGVGVLLKMPPCVTYGEALIIGGVNFAIDGYAGRVDEDKERNNKNCLLN